MQNQLTTLLNNGLTMPLLGLGVYDMHGKEAEQAMAWALETGYRLFDTAAMYRNETEIGNAIRAGNIPRSELFVTTKVADSDQGFDATMKAFDTSSRKINCDYIDLYLMHWPVKGKRRETWRALETLYTEKRVRAIGVANYLLPFLKELETYGSVIPVVNQIEFSPYLFQKNELAYCSNRKIQLQAYTPLVRGSRMKDPKLLSVAHRYGKTPAQIILRWILQKGVSAIPKSVTRERIVENFDLFDFELKPEDLSYIDTFNENLRVCEDPMDLW